MKKLIEEWAEAVRFYRLDEARSVARTLIPLLAKSGAIDKDHAVTIDSVAYWVENSEIKRERLHYE
jgi:hypothetical protein